MSEMIERVARALAERYDDSMGWPKGTAESIPHGETAEPGLHGFLNDARVAIKAMSNPTDEMINDGFAALESAGSDGIDCVICFNAMISSALKEPTR